MARVDYYNDPNAPEPNSLVPSVTAAVRDDDGRLLLVHLVEDDLWALPGGVMAVGESVADAAIREVAAQTGVRVEITGLVGIYSSPGHVVAHDGGEVRQEFSVCFHARPQDGQPLAAPEPTVAWVAARELDELPIHLAMLLRINDALSDDRVRPRIA